MSLILGIETSCDETAAAVVERGRVIRSNVIASQFDLHEPYGGVVPEIAGRAHLERLAPVIEQALTEAGIDLEDIHAVAVGNRPGLIGSLLIGVSAAQALAWRLDVPLLGIDHVLAHLYAPVMRLPTDVSDEHAPDGPYPALGLVVSGGHTTLYLAHDPLNVDILGRTIDDAAGEAFDKAAVMLGLPFPGGPNLDALARTATQTVDPPLPRGLLRPDTLNCTFSGLKTSLLYRVRGHPVGRGKEARFTRDHHDLSPDQRAALARGFQEAVVDTLIAKLESAIAMPHTEGRAPKSILTGGGVVANSLLRSELERLGGRVGLPVHIPPSALCVDNAAMIAGMAWHRLRRGERDALDLPAVATSSLTQSRAPRPSVRH
ncbi:MAG: tRNA (adenosine(37)-N6)-threonylcarbamoyltransferase complex transferase subunit TsaD [Phycisphaeraceae bacterium]|nr:tRNA (adenosine(37)-N6)-threonylcarbamoyltransferase complex transferase subunit TsaD [Phycisphaeraceae bacterium]